MVDTTAIPPARLSGRQLDAAVHREVFGHVVLWELEPARDRQIARDGRSGDVVPAYSSDQAAGLQVTSWLSQRGYSFQPNAGAGHGRLVRGDRTVAVLGPGDDTLIQRCRAAVLAAREESSSG